MVALVPWACWEATNVPTTDDREEDTWMNYHDRLKIWWEKESDSQDYLKSLPCPVEGNPNRTWYDRQIKIWGENNAKAAKRYKNCLPGDSLPSDCHFLLFVDKKETAAKNVALTYHIKENDEYAGLKYSFATPAKFMESLQQTIAAGCPSTKRIAEEDIKRIFHETLGRSSIAEAKGCYIEDSSKRIVRSGM
jgi:hypothetical protein